MSMLAVLSPGESEKPCVVGLMDDSIHEEKEEFRLVLGTAKSKSPYGALIGEQKEALVTVTDDKDSKFFSYTQHISSPFLNYEFLQVFFSQNVFKLN